MVTLAFYMEWIARNPFVKFKPRLEKREREFLTKHELKRIIDISTSIERLSIVRDLFIFSCYTGISYGDIMDLTKKCIVIGIDGDQWLIETKPRHGIFKTKIEK
tara:strand:+ start:320 stop:631 length:312 start_codon:yes stop_codon:yes gene_type:complete